MELLPIKVHDYKNEYIRMLSKHRKEIEDLKLKFIKDNNIDKVYKIDTLGQFDEPLYFDHEKAKRHSERLNYYNEVKEIPISQMEPHLIYRIIC